MMMTNRPLAIPPEGAGSKRGKLARTLRAGYYLDWNAIRPFRDGKGMALPLAPDTL